MNILVCVENDSASKRAVTEAIDLVKQSNSDTITLAHILSPSYERNGDELVTVGGETQHERGSQLLGEFQEYVEKEAPGIKIKTELIDSNEKEADAVLTAAETVGADQIIVGHRALDDQYEAIKSFAKRLISVSPVPVLVVPAVPDDKAARAARRYEQWKKP